MTTSRSESKMSGERMASEAGNSSLAALASFVQQTFPQVEVRWKLHHASFLIGGKVFAFTRPEGVVLKLPEERIHALTQTRNAEFLVMGKRTMREWVLLRYAHHAECAEDGMLLEEALRFVSLQE